MQDVVFGTKVASVRLEADGVARRSAASLPAGANLEVVLLYDATLRQAFDAEMKVSLLRGGVPVQTTSCKLLKENRDGEEGSVTGVISPTTCKIAVPAGGADAMEASYWVKPAGGVVYDRLELALYRKE